MIPTIVLATVLFSADLNRDSPEVKDYLSRCYAIRVRLVTIAIKRNDSVGAERWRNTLPIALFPQTLRVGDIGGFGNATVEKMIDANTALCEMRWATDSPRQVTGPGGSFSASPTHLKQLVLIRAQNIKTLPGGFFSSTPGSIFRVSTEEPLQTPFRGHRTLLLLEPIDSRSWLPKKDELPPIDFAVAESAEKK